MKSGYNFFVYKGKADLAHKNLAVSQNFSIKYIEVRERYVL